MGMGCRVNPYAGDDPSSETAEISGMAANRTWIGSSRRATLGNTGINRDPMAGLARL